MKVVKAFPSSIVLYLTKQTIDICLDKISIDAVDFSSIYRDYTTNKCNQSCVFKANKSNSYSHGATFKDRQKIN